MLPATVMLGSVGLLAFGSPAAVTTLKSCDQALRYSLDQSTRELLYLPLAARVKIQVKWFLDTVVWRLGDGLSGLAVLVFATLLHMPARQISWVVLVLVSIWLLSVAIARKEYVATLKESISQHRVDVEQASTSVLDRSTTELMASGLTASDPKEILYALSLFELERQRAAHPVIRSLLSHPSPEVRQKAIQILSESGDKTVRADIERLIRDPDLNVRTEALLYLTHHAHVDPLELMQARPTSPTSGQFGGCGIFGATGRDSNTGGSAADPYLHRRGAVTRAPAASGGGGPLAGRAPGLL